ncbi:MAG: hypothetical protein PWR22_1995 [Moorella sp. (in: firmicutes)]|jgi:hypothetical protein|nr:hypothetical protein [Moorella sp. (in: firmicutes)]MDK2894150.1 hypothetical protein [Moorella sp. (in: firmicutes)]GEA14425.1 hypothetical protein E308F_06670 [Moorella sp. E308F]GEA18203.1 hypothetical protein E306M_13390 [Moorella sp. E306M]
MFLVYNDSDLKFIVPMAMSRESRRTRGHQRGTTIGWKWTRIPGAEVLLGAAGLKVK